MPIYIYRCENCGVQFERQQKFSDPALTICPECNKKTLRKVYQPVGIVFKGSGFYATDNRSPSGTGRSKNSSKTEESSDKSTSTDKVKESSSEPKAGSSEKSDSSS